MNIFANDEYTSLTFKYKRQDVGQTNKKNNFGIVKKPIAILTLNCNVPKITVFLVYLIFFIQNLGYIIIICVFNIA